jgi:hypothetical protein
MHHAHMLASMPAGPPTNVWREPLRIEHLHVPQSAPLLQVRAAAGKREHGGAGHMVSRRVNGLARRWPGCSDHGKGGWILVSP